MIPLHIPTNINALPLNGKSIEYVVNDRSFQNNFWVNIAPINSASKTGKINFVLIKKFVGEFFVQLDKKRDFFSEVSLLTLLKYFVDGSAELLSLNPNSISVELTSATSIFFFAKKEDHNIYFEIFFDENSGKFSDAVVNVYKNKSQCFAINGSINYVVKKIDDFLKPTSHNYYQYFQSTYGISDEITPAYTL